MLDVLADWDESMESLFLGSSGGPKWRQSSSDMRERVTEVNAKKEESTQECDEQRRG